MDKGGAPQGARRDVVEREVLPADFLAEMDPPRQTRGFYAHSRFYENTIGREGCRLFRIVRPGGDCMFLKYGPPGRAEELNNEVSRCAWAWDKLPTPRVVDFTRSPSGAYFLMTEMPGLPSHLCGRPAVEVARMLFQGLERLASVPVEGCPFDMRLESRLRAAEERIRDGRVDASDFEGEHLGKSPGELFEELVRRKPREQTLRVCHGDYCLPNVVIDPLGGIGFIDLGRLGVCDPAQDIALCARSLRHNFPENPEVARGFLDACGIHPDQMDRIRYYELLDELF